MRVCVYICIYCIYVYICSEKLFLVLNSCNYLWILCFKWNRKTNFSSAAYEHVVVYKNRL